jgi:hypothetical protein
MELRHKFSIVQKAAAAVRRFTAPAGAGSAKSDRAPSVHAKASAAPAAQKKSPPTLAEKKPVNRIRRPAQAPVFTPRPVSPDESKNAIDALSLSGQRFAEVDS